MKPLAIYTWGYEGRIIADLQKTMAALGSWQIVDVRRTNTGARVKKGWSRDDLYEEFGRGYISECDLGNMGKTPVWERGAEAAEALVRTALMMLRNRYTPALLLCKERGHLACHRAEVAEALVAILAAAGVECEVRHLGEEVTGV